MTIPAPAEDPLLAYRDQFPILSRTNYLISNSLGAVPSSAFDRLREYVETWATRGSGPGRRPGGAWRPTSATWSRR